MKFGRLLLLPWVISTAAATSVTLTDSPDWHPLSEEQTASIRENFAGVMKDFSIDAASGTSALFVELPVPKEPNSSRLRFQRINTVAGAKSSITKRGFATISEGGASFGPLPGAYIVFASPRPAEQPNILMLMGFSRDKVYSICFYSNEKPDALSADLPFVKNYFSRMSFTDVKLLEEDTGVDPNSKAYKIGRMIGYLSAPFLVMAIGGGFAYLSYRLLFRKKPATDLQEPT